MANEAPKTSRREMLRTSLAVAGGAAAAGLGLRSLLGRAVGDDDRRFWQIDPAKCTKCGLCATRCVLTPSAVKCIHSTTMCGYCELCFGYFEPQPDELNEAAENQTCPVGAIRRRRVNPGQPYYEYEIDNDLCIGCGKCVVGCEQYGNGSLYLQVNHDYCKNCNECAIAVACPADAFVRVTPREAYQLKVPRRPANPEGGA